MKSFKYHPDNHIYIQNGDLTYQDTLANFKFDCTTANLQDLPLKPTHIREFLISKEGLSYAITTDCCQTAFSAVGQDVELYSAYIENIPALLMAQTHRNSPSS